MFSSDEQPVRIRIAADQHVLHSTVQKVRMNSESCQKLTFF